jgi:hypothetical protein
MRGVLGATTTPVYTSLPGPQNEPVTEPHRDVVGRVGVDLRCCRLVLSSALVNARGVA